MLFLETATKTVDRTVLLALSRCHADKLRGAKRSFGVPETKNVFDKNGGIVSGCLKSSAYNATMLQRRNKLKYTLCR